MGNVNFGQVGYLGLDQLLVLRTLYDIKSILELSTGLQA